MTKKIINKVNKGDKIKKSEFIKSLKENLSKKSDMSEISDNSDKLKANNDLKTTIVKEIENHKKDDKGLNKSIYRNNKEFTDDSIIKYYNEKTEANAKNNRDSDKDDEY
ncbi:5358_t:CDS:2 [Funneliformis geosporum]|uniref:5358_t:CDS:1 n=1 Tax=Funneliformis geosporum TaxID=1117311 RepID=A0A9W4T1K2_9GLOM|nr:5358_t:CDS:2 [Funneliformis geosporum]